MSILDKLLKIKAVMSKPSGDMKERLFKWLPHLKSKDEKQISKFLQEFFGFPEEIAEKFYEQYSSYDIGDILSYLGNVWDLDTLALRSKELDQLKRLPETLKKLKKDYEEYSSGRLSQQKMLDLEREIQQVGRLLESTNPFSKDAILKIKAEGLPSDADIFDILEAGALPDTPEELSDQAKDYIAKLERLIEQGYSIAEPRLTEARKNIMNQVSARNTPFRTVFDEEELQEDFPDFEEQSRKGYEELIDKALEYDELKQQRDAKHLYSPVNVYWELIRTLNMPFFSEFNPDHPAPFKRVDQNLIDIIMQETDEILKNPKYDVTLGPNYSEIFTAEQEFSKNQRNREVQAQQRAYPPYSSEQGYLIPDYLRAEGYKEPSVSEKLAKLTGYDDAADLIFARARRDKGEDKGSFVDERTFNSAMTSAQNPETPPAELEALAKLKDPRIRRVIAGNPNTPKEALLKLGVEYPEEFFDNPIFPYLLLEDPVGLFSDIPRNSVMSMLKAPNVPREFAEWASNNKDEKIAKRAKKIVEDFAQGGKTPDADWGFMSFMQPTDQPAEIANDGVDLPVQPETNFGAEAPQVLAEAPTEDLGMQSVVEPKKAPATTETPKIETFDSEVTSENNPEEVSEQQKSLILKYVKNSNLTSITKSFIYEIFANRTWYNNRYMSLTFNEKMHVYVEVPEKVPGKKPVFSGFSKDKLYKVYGIYAPAHPIESGESHYILINDEDEIYFISNKYLKFAGTLG